MEEHTRQALEAANDISQSSLGRILGDLEPGEWVRNEHNGAYTLTPLGALVAGEIEDLLTVLDSSHRLTAVADALPLEDPGFGLRDLAAATVTTPNEQDPLAPIRRFDELAASSASVRVSSNGLACRPASESSGVQETILDDVDELVVTDDGIEGGLGDPALRDWIRDRLENGELELYRYDGSFAFLLGWFDDVVGIIPIDDAGVPVGLIETSTPSVREWCGATFEDYRESATRITADNLTN